MNLPLSGLLHLHLLLTLFTTTLIFAPTSSVAQQLSSPTHSVELKPSSLNYNWQLDYDTEVLSVEVEYAPPEQDVDYDRDGERTFKGTLKIHTYSSRPRV